MNSLGLILLFGGAFAQNGHLGCYTDSSRNRIYRNEISYTGLLSPSVCFSACRAAGHRYFGLQVIRSVLKILSSTALNAFVGILLHHLTESLLQVIAPIIAPETFLE